MRRKLAIFLMGLAGLGLVAAIAAEPTDGSDGLLVLKSGQVVRGRIVQAGDRVLVVVPDGELRFKASEVDFSCRDLEEAYARNRAVVPDRAEARLDLADWCLRQGLVGHAADELSDALRLDPRNVRIAALERRIEQIRTNAQPGQNPAKAAVTELQSSNNDLDQLVRSLPRGTMETFTSVVQPLLLNSCAASGCHGPRPGSKLALERMPLEGGLNRRLTQRNLQAVLDRIDFQDPTHSAIFTVSAAPHGSAKTAIFGNRQSSQYRQLVDWVTAVTKSDDGALPANVLAPKAAMLQTLTEFGFETGEPANAPARSSIPKQPPTTSRRNPNDRGSTGSPAPTVTQRGTSTPPLPARDPFDPEEFNRSALPP